ncbi:MAG: PrsW family glutamic-type intramembrane protease [Candidatus Kariarchaeaceae archaeon]|jgi:RsiW-degrading membrane proteinase PrsW (M82 family)
MADLLSFLNGPYGWLVILAIIISFTVLTILYYTRKDKYDPEPKSRLLYAFFLGIISIVPAIILSLIGGIFIGFDLFLMSVLIAPVTEEIAKLYFVIYLAKSDEFDGPLDGLIYGAMVGAGFAAAENLLYGYAALVGEGIASGIALTAIRSVTQIIGHPLYTGLAGVGVGEWKVGLEASKYGKLWRSMLFHGAWNLSANLWSVSAILIGLGTVIVVNIIFLRREFHRTIALDKLAWERGYYDQKSRLPTQHPRWQQGPPVSGLATPDPTGPQLAETTAESGTDPVIPQDETAPSAPSFCRNCGMKRTPGDIFCRTCGTKMI